MTPNTRTGRRSTQAIDQVETGAAVVQHDPGVGHRDAGAPGVKQAVDQRSRVAVLIHHTQVHGVAMFGHLRLDRLAHGGGADPGGQRFGQFLRQQAAHGHLAELGVA